MLRATILIVGHDPEALQALRLRLLPHGLWVTEASDERSIQDAFRSPPKVVILACTRSEFRRDVELARMVRATDWSIPLVVFAAVSCEELAIEAVRLGAREYIRGCDEPELLVLAARRYLTSPEPGQLFPRPDHATMIGNSTTMRNLREFLLKLAANDVSVLITGDTGTGKELAAEMIHQHSARSRKPMVCINCAAIPDTLLESELFGHTKGAFTGANTFRDGKLLCAQGGTVFLDEIGDMSISAQARILRAIETRRVEPIGSNRSTALDIRVTAATNQPIEKLIREGRFRQDLYFRLNVARVHLPPLRERQEDLPALLNYYLHDVSLRLGRKVDRFSADALDVLCAYEWPGNVRELKNLIESVFVTCNASMATIKDLPEHIRKLCSAAPSRLETEKAMILDALAACKWNRSKAAEQLHWSRMTLYRKFKRHNIRNKNKDRAA